MTASISRKSVLMAICFTISIFWSAASAEEDTKTVTFADSLSQQGYISFTLQTDTTYRNGGNEDPFSQVLFDLPGLGTCAFERSHYSIFLYFVWANQTKHNGFYILFDELPGPEEYHIQFTWDARRGLADGYVNGVSFRTEREKYYQPWEVKGSATQIDIPPGPNKISNVDILAEYLPGETVKQKVPNSLLGKTAHLTSPSKLSSRIDVSERRGSLLYESKMDSEDSIGDWILEGPGEINFENSKMIMRSQIPDPPDGSTGHFNIWCPADFPENIIVEWDFQPLSDVGVCHIYTAARGKNGEDIFDPSLPPRDGHFQQYINDAINNYYTIYFTNRRMMRTTNFATSWLVKSSNASVMTLGQTAVAPGDKRFHRMRLIKEGGHIQLFTDDKLCLDFTDPGNERWGEILGGGKISLRQMAVTVAAYRNFQVWELLN